MGWSWWIPCDNPLRRVSFSAAATAWVLALVVAVAVVVIPTRPAIAAPVEIKYLGLWEDPIYAPVEKALIDQFNREHEGRIVVSALAMPTGETETVERLLVMLASGQSPDVAKVDRFTVASLASGGALLPLDRYVSGGDLNPKDFFPATWQEGVYKGKPYAVPWNTDARALYYNLALFEEVGLDSKKPPRTWEELDQYAKKLDIRLPDGSYERLGFVPHLGNWYFLGWLYAAGGDILNEDGTKVAWDSPAGLKAAEWMQSYLRKLGGGAVLDQWLSRQQQGTISGLINGNLAMIVDGSWWGSTLKRNAPKGFQFSVAPPPRPRELANTPITWSGGHALVIPAGTRHAAEALEFVKFYTSEKAQLELAARTGQLPARVKAAVSEQVMELGPYMKLFVQLLPYSRCRFVTPAGSELWRIYNDRLMELLRQDRLSAAQIIQQTAEEGQRALDRILKGIKN